MYQSENIAPNATNQVVAFDDEGFIINEYLWTHELAQQIASREGLGELNEKHWRVLDALRSKYQQLGGMPSMRSVCKSAGVVKYEVYSLFGNCLTVWKVAGLPDPGDEVKNYMR